MATEKIKGFVGRVLEKLTGGDEAKITRFQKKAIKFYTTQIGIREGEIETLKEKLEDLVERRDEELINVDLDRIKTSEALADYIPSYTRNILSIKSSMKTVDADIEAKQTEIDEFKELIEFLKG